ncbi:MAG: chemotaxis protein CheA [Proteobacteria bacterium]|nr:MAG: chemotaxis protein CheA [Pseudomonadota bacterium]
MAAARAPGRQASVRVPADKLDRLVDLVGELVISMSRVESAVLKQEDREERQAALESLAQIGEELQESVMAVRMVPIEELFLRYKRVVRDLAGALGKQARLVIEGAHTELDKTVIERLADPLKHLVRNALDHGLETPEVRAAAGKEAKGTVWLRAKQQGGNIVIELADDGAGIDPERVLAKARERGLVGPDETPSPSEINAFLLAPGFSTAAKVTDVSGRGVGLDVVHRNINELRGSIAIQSEPGQGTVFRITLPLTLAIIEGLVVRVGDELLTIPMLSVLEQLRPSREQLMTVQGRGEVVVVRGEFLPLLRLHELLGFGCHEPDPTKALVVIVEHEEQRLCLLVDEVLEQEQAVVKPLERNFRSVEGIAGATIRGDGGVSLILDIRGVARMGRQAGLVARCADAANDSLAAKLRGPIAAVA